MSVLWHDRPAEPPSAALDGHVRAEVVVVGGGVAGLMCARRLAERGRDVVLLEADRCGAGASGRSSGFVTPDSEVGLATLVSTVGADRAEALWRFVLSGVEALRGEAVDCGYEVQRSFLVASSRGGRRAVEDEHEAQTSLGFAAHLHDRARIPDLLGTGAYHAAVEYGGTFALDPYALCRGLRQRLLDAGVRIHESTRVTAVAPGRATTATGTVRADIVVVCADRCDPALGLLPDEVYHLQTFLLATTPLSAEDRERLFPTGPLMVWDTDLVYHYLRPTHTGRLLLGGGDLSATYAESHPNSAARAHRRIERHFRRRFPELAFEISHAWSGQLGVSKDLLPVLSREPGLVAIGAATGLPWAAALGRLVADTLIGVADDDPWDWFAAGRDWPVSDRLQRVFGRKLSFAVSHGIRKELQ